jgi:hypothetical protein
MNFKFLVLTFALAIHTGAYAASRNLCDDLAESSDSTKDQVQKCQDKIGVSDFAKTKQLKQKTEAISKAKSQAIEAAKVDNVETKVFSQSELIEAGFGKPFFAVTNDYRFGFKQERITKGDTLCSYLGYTKAVKSVLSMEMNQEDSNKKGLVLDTGFFGTKKDPELYKQDNPKIGVRQYVEVTCAKNKDNKSDALKAVVEELEVLDNSIQAMPISINGESQIVNGKRDSKPTTPHGYKTPEWMKENGAAGTAK